MGRLLDAALMPAGLDQDGRCIWWALGTIARANDNFGADSRHLITSDELDEWDDGEWEQLAIDTPELTGDFDGPQRALLISTLRDLERQDLGRLDAWWTR
jgi:hypothetical protein